MDDLKRRISDIEVTLTRVAAAIERFGVAIESLVGDDDPVPCDTCGFDLRQPESICRYSECPHGRHG